MLRNYILIAWRNFRRQRIFSFINVFGLAVGMASCMLIFSYVGFEQSYDRHLRHADEIYRVNSYIPQEESNAAITFPGIAPGLNKDFPEIRNATHIFPANGTILITSNGEKRSFKEDRVIYADSNFFQVFSIDTNDSTALNKPFSVLLSESTAKKYFGSTNIVDKVLAFYDNFGQVLYTVRGTFSDIPENSHGKFDIILSEHHIMGDIFEERSLAGWRAFYTYIRVHPQVDIQNLEQKISAAVGSYIYSDQKDKEKLRLQPLTDIYLGSEGYIGNLESGNNQLIYLLSVLAIFILVLAWTNYINLSTARSLERAREVGIRKVLGSGRQKIILQFLLEAVLINILASTIAFTLAQLGLPFIQELTGKPLSTFGYWGLRIGGWILLASLFLVGAILSGWYPSLVLSSFNPTEVLRGVFSKGIKGLPLRKILVTFQFSIATILITASLAVYFQLNYMLQADTGLELRQKLIVEASSLTSKNLSHPDVLENEWKKISGVEDVIVSGSIPGVNFQFATGVWREEQSKEDRREVKISYIQDDFFQHFDIPMVYGRDFPKDSKGKKHFVIINESAANVLEIPIAERSMGISLFAGDSENSRELIGIVKNYHHNSLQFQYEPTIFLYVPTNNYYSIQIAAESHQLPAIRDQIEETFTGIYPSAPFESFFLDDIFEDKYISDRTMVKLLGSFTFLALFLAILGIFGLAAYHTSRRTKEISIRKIHGARFQDLLSLLSKDFMRLILVASFIGIPIAVFGVWKWLSGYAFHITPGLEIYVLPIIIVFTVGFLTVSGQVIRSVNVNPADVLRHE